MLAADISQEGSSSPRILSERGTVALDEITKGDPRSVVHGLPLLESLEVLKGSRRAL